MGKFPELAQISLWHNWKLKENILFEKSDIILTPNLDEGKIISQLNKAYRVEVILPFFYNKNAVPVKNFEQRKSILFIGGFNHLPNIDAVQWFVNEVWPIVIKQIPDATFFLAGSNPTEEILSLESNSIKILGYQTEKELEDLYTKIKIAVIPLRYGAGVKGKTIEAMYNGVPIVSTSFGLEGIPPFDETFLPKCDEAVSFAHQIITLYNDNQKLEILSEYETNYINKFFTNDIAKKTMSRLLEIDN